MKKTIWMMFVFIGLGSIGAQVQASKLMYQGKPKILFYQTSFNWGKVREGPDITHLFWFKNIGTGVLTIHSVGTSCGCTAAAQQKNNILPGHTSYIKVTYHTSGRPGMATKYISVNSNAPNEPTVVLTMKMNVIQEIAVMPDGVYFYGLKKNQPAHENVNLLGKIGLHFHITSIQVEKNLVTVSSKPMTLENQSGYKLHVALRPGLPIGDFNDEIIIKTDCPKKPIIHIQVFGQIVGRVQVYPSSIYFPAPPPHGRSLPVTLHLEANPWRGFIVRRIATQNHLIRPWVQRQFGDNGSVQYTVIVSLPKHLPRMSSLQDKLYIYTNVADQSKLTIPVQAAGSE
jgi:hypothetical protein